jgi:transposase
MVSKPSTFGAAKALKKTYCEWLNGFDSALSNGSVEAINGLVQAAKARTRGYRKPRNLILIAYLIAGNLSHLPASSYTTTSGGCRA